MLLATMLAGPEHLGRGDASGPSFVHVFVLVWSGAASVTLNTILLGGSLSFFQCLCALGYCLLPLNIAVIICRILSIVGTSNLLFIVQTLSVAAALVWAVLASIGFVATTQPRDKKLLVIYPIFLFYFAMSILTLATINSN
ncbi:YIPF6 [Oopsacas minuta]|uniref:Protein YIPF n=1 Tax=Oopsacas minuta TaxID=111878 RepID=A0AAV7JCC1_9METZ|nr:YIPF6 [Oopsacas minuta]